MTRVQVVLPLALALLVTGCTENTAPGNDREAALSPPAPPAEVADVGTATEGVATDMLIPQTMTDADVRNAPDVRDQCLFRFTRVGMPVFVYGSADGSAGVIKLNGKLVALPAANAGAPGVDAVGTRSDAGGPGMAAGGAGTDVRRYAAGPVSVMVRPLDGAPSADEAVLGELVLHLADASHELGYHGYLECGT